MDVSSQDESAPPQRYDARLAGEIELRWQDYWEDQHTFWAPNPTGDLSDGFAAEAGKKKLFVLDMFPYPSGAGLHVGHPLGYIGTDVWARFHRANGYNVLHSLGYDAFGLPAEQYALETGQHPRVATEANVAMMRRQLRALGLGHDSRRSVSTTDPDYYRWTQWIFLQIYNAWYDYEADQSRPITDLISQLSSGERPAVISGSENTDAPEWSKLSKEQQAKIVDSYRLAYQEEAPVNWCPGLGTVLANEEVTSEGRSERGNFPVFKRPLKQWKLRITAYADRLLADLEDLDWPEPIKIMQRNWIGRSTGALVSFSVETKEKISIDVFTTRPDTLFGATYLVLAPEHPLVDSVVPAEWPTETPLAWRSTFGIDVLPSEAVRKYREFVATKTELERQAEGREKTGVFSGTFARNPANDTLIPIFLADYVLMGYGTGAIMAVPGQDQRDWEFAQEFDLPIVRTVAPPDSFTGDAYTGDGPAINSDFLNGLRIQEAKKHMTDWLVEHKAGWSTTVYKLRDWLFSRQRYWGEPFPIVYSDDGQAHALLDSMLPVELPEVDDFRPQVLDPEDDDHDPEPPLARALDWVNVDLDLGDGTKTYRRETNTMPQWAGSCWYYLRYLDPRNPQALVDPEVEAYWMQDPNGFDAGGVDLYVGGVEHAVLHLLYARFWHKVLFDLGVVSTREPFRRLYNQGYIQAPAFRDARGMAVEATKVSKRGDEFFLGDEPVTREFGKMGKSLKNVVTPDDISQEYGADTLRLYEMFMGPLDASRPWSTADIVGVHRFLQRVWRNLIDEETGEPRITEEPPDLETRQLMHQTIDAVRADMVALKFNTAIARLFELNNRLTQVVNEQNASPREVATNLVLLLSPLTPHIAEELWRRLGHENSLAYEPFPVADPSELSRAEIEIPVQINGKVRSRITVAANAAADEIEAAARSDEHISALLVDTTVNKVIVVPGRLVNFVIG